MGKMIESGTDAVLASHGEARAKAFYALRRMLAVHENSISAGPIMIGPQMSPINVRKRRDGSHSVIARQSTPSTSPPKAPRPVCHPSGMSAVNRWGQQE